MGVAHHASYWPWLEIARTELLRARGVSYAQLEADGVFLVIVDVQGKYRRPARYDDVLEIRVGVEGGSPVKIRHTYEVVRIDAGAGPGATDHPGEPAGAPLVLMTAATTLACVGRDGRVRALPEWLVPGPDVPAGPMPGA